MASRTWLLSKDTNTISGYGNGSEQHAPIGLWSGLVFRAFMQYAVDVSGMASISAASIHIKSGTATHVGFGSSPTVKVRRVTSSWVGSGGTEGAWSASGDPNRTSNAEPTTTATGETSNSMTTTHSTWDTIDVTDIANDWLAGSANYGVRLVSSDEASTAKTWEGYAQASSYDSYITVTYTATVVASPPSATPVEPLTGALADMSYTAGSGWASPRPTVDWSFSDPDGNAQDSYRVIVYNDSAGSAGSTLYDSGRITSTATLLTVPATFVEGNYYHWQVDVWDSTGLEASAFTANQRFRTRWGAGEYIANLGATPSAWSLNTLNTTGTVKVEYNSTTATGDPGAGLGTWAADLGSVTLQQYLRYRVWLLPNNAVAPSLDKIVFNYQTSALPAPDNWTLSAHAGNDTSVQVYGTKSLKISPISVDERSYQLVTIQPNTRYMLSAFIKQTVVGVNPYISVGTTTTSAGDIATAPGSTSDTDWTRAYVSFDSGALNQVYVGLGASGAGSCWFDAVQLVASTELTPWMPALISNAVTLDASGLRIDGSLGGSVRLRGSTGGTRDIVELGANGLKLGGDTNLYSAVAGVLKTDGILDTATSSSLRGFKHTAFPGSPSSGDRFWRSDLNQWFFYDGTRWITTELYSIMWGGGPRSLFPISASAAGNWWMPMGLRGCSDIYLVDIDYVYQVTSGTLDGANFYAADFTKLVKDGAGATSIGLVTINSGATALNRSGNLSVAALLNNGTVHAGIYVSLAKTGAPAGSLYFGANLNYRLVAT